jgi:hypothetical protein
MFKHAFKRFLEYCYFARILLERPMPSLAATDSISREPLGGFFAIAFIIFIFPYTIYDYEKRHAETGA